MGVGGKVELAAPAIDCASRCPRVRLPGFANRFIGAFCRGPKWAREAQRAALPQIKAAGKNYDSLTGPIAPGAWH